MTLVFHLRELMHKRFVLSSKNVKFFNVQFVSHSFFKQNLDKHVFFKFFIFLNS